MHPVVQARLAKVPSEPLSKVQFNQLLVISGEASVSDGFFQYYWCSCPEHSYNITAIPGHGSFLGGTVNEITSLEQMAWGLERAYIDGLLYFGSIAAGFRSLRSQKLEDIKQFFFRKRFDTEAIINRGPALPLNPIKKDDRYLISEMACKTFGELPDDATTAKRQLQEALAKHHATGNTPIGFKELLSTYIANPSNSEQLFLSYDDVINDQVDSEASLIEKFDAVLTKFLDSRDRATKNTELYLSMVNDLDVYVATSMRSRRNFRDMADACEQIFGHSTLLPLHLRHFDPTMSAAKGHEDKGLIECLMVKCAKVLVYCEGEKESYGKDAEAAMALSLGKPVIFFCDKGVKTNFYKDVHPLARLIDFRSGVAVGAIVSDDADQVATLLNRIFKNQMEYRLAQHPTRPGFLKLMERLTQSVVRLQTDSELITKTFWNNYHNRQERGFTSLAAGKEAERLLE
jgi:hypothetical protein